MRVPLCEECGHRHPSGYCAETCRLCMLEELGEYDADELGLDPEEEWDYDATA